MILFFYGCSVRVLGDMTESKLDGLIPGSPQDCLELYHRIICEAVSVDDSA